MKKIAISLLLFLLCAPAVRAQYDAMFTQYMFNEVFINPAYAGSKEAMSATLLHRQQWVSFPGRPVTTSFSLHGPVMGNKMGAGISILSEKVGVLNRNLVYGTYAYRLKLAEKKTLAFGIMGGIDNQKNRLGEVKASADGAPADPQFLQNTPGAVAANFGTGVYFNTKDLYAGISIPRLLDNNISFSPDGKVVKVTSFKASKFTYYLTGGYLFHLSDELKLRANTMIKLLGNAPAQVDLGANLLIKETFWAGLSYRSKTSVSMLLGMQINPQFLACYSYDYGVNSIQRYSSGSHEIVLNYLFSFTGRKVITPRYF